MIYAVFTVGVTLEISSLRWAAACAALHFVDHFGHSAFVVAFQQLFDGDQRFLPTTGNRDVRLWKV